MTARAYLQLDVFADRPGAGNPLGVVFDADDLDVATMHAIANWTNLSETIFLLAPTTPEADYRVRIFTPRQELPFAGHPSVGAAWAVLEQALARADTGRLVQECAAGLLPVRVESRDGAHVVHVRSPRASQVTSTSGFHDLLATALDGLAPGTIAPALWQNGPRWWVVQLADGDAVRAMQPRLGDIAALTIASGAVGLTVHGRATSEGHDIVVRAYCPADNIPEDPVTGSANAVIAASLQAHGLLPTADAGGGGRYIASQGREIGRDGRVEIEVDADGDVWIGGQVQSVIRGEFDWSPAVADRAEAAGPAAKDWDQSPPRAPDSGGSIDW